MMTLRAALLWLCGLCCCVAPLQAAQTPWPDWLEQIRQQKNIQPAAMLRLALQHEPEFSGWPVSLQAQWLSELSTVYEVLGRHQEQLSTAERALSLLPQSQGKTRVEVLYSLGFALEMNREYSKANGHYQQGMALATELGDEKLMIEGQLNLAAMAAEENEDQTALELLKDAYQRAVKLNDKESLASVNAELGLMYTMLMSDEEARQLLEASYRLYDELGWQNNKISVWYNLAMTYLMQKKNSEALEIFDKMLKVAIEAEDPVQLYYAYFGLAATQSARQKYEQAIAYMEQADSYLPSLQSTYQLAEHHFEKALMLRALGQTRLALQEVDLAAQSLGEKPNSSDQTFALHFDRLRAGLYADNGDYQKAYQALDRFFKDYVSQRDDERDLQVQKLRLSFDAERQHARNELLEKDNELQALRLLEVERKRQNQWLWIGLFATTSLILLALLLRQWRRVPR